jgi:hypothetical protein
MKGLKSHILNQVMHNSCHIEPYKFTCNFCCNLWNTLWPTVVISPVCFNSYNNWKKFSKIELVVKENPKYAIKIVCLLQGSTQQFGDESPWICEALTYQLRPPTKPPKERMDHI